MTSTKTHSTIKNSINEFSFKLFRAFISRHKDDSSNMCFAPLEVFNSLVMLLIGARGITEAQLEDMLCLTRFNSEEKYNELTDLFEWIIKSNHDMMVYGTFIYIDSRVTIDPKYIEKLKTIFEIKPKRIDFNRLEEAIRTINKDAYGITDGVIEDVISLSELKDETQIKLIISNAIFFRGYWQIQFTQINKGVFHYSNGTKKACIDMMTHTGQYRYYYDEELKSHSVSIAYAASDIRMVIILPKDDQSEANYLVDLLSAEKLGSMFNKLQSLNKTRTELTLPRFALQAQRVSLQRSVKQMGAKSLYDPDTAQLTGISTTDKIHLTKLVHKAFILVDERGSCATTKQTQEERFMTSMDWMECDENDAPSSQTFCANHPFVFIILDKITGVICYTGIFANPLTILEVINEKDLSREETMNLLMTADDGQP